MVFYSEGETSVKKRTGLWACVIYRQRSYTSTLLAPTGPCENSTLLRKITRLPGLFYIPFLRYDAQPDDSQEGDRVIRQTIGKGAQLDVWPNKMIL